jgi:hypothetical protein
MLPGVVLRELSRWFFLAGLYESLFIVYYVGRVGLELTTGGL